MSRTSPTEGEDGEGEHGGHGGHGGQRTRLSDRNAQATPGLLQRYLDEIMDSDEDITSNDNDTLSDMNDPQDDYGSHRPDSPGMRAYLEALHRHVDDVGDNGDVNDNYNDSGDQLSESKTMEADGHHDTLSDEISTPLRQNYERALDDTEAETEEEQQLDQRLGKDDRSADRAQTYHDSDEHSSVAVPSDEGGMDNSFPGPLSDSILMRSIIPSPPPNHEDDLDFSYLSSPIYTACTIAAGKNLNSSAMTGNTIDKSTDDSPTCDDSPSTTRVCSPDLSLEKCRKVSVLVKINPLNCRGLPKTAIKNTRKRTSQKPSLAPHQSCVFPSESNNPGELVLVNPEAFGKFLPTSMTVAAAKIIYETSHIASEDWARHFRFDDVIWPDQPAPNIETQSPSGSSNASGNKIWCDAFANAIGDDSLDRNLDCTCLAYGAPQSGKTMAMFGENPQLAMGTHALNRNSVPGLIESVVHRLLMGLARQKVRDQDENDDSGKDQSPQRIITLSAVEVCHDDDLRDFLIEFSATNAQDRPEKLTKLRVVELPDRSGAVTQNLTEVVVDNLSTLQEAMTVMRHKLHPGQNSKPSRERGHVIVTVKLHDEIHNDRGQCCIQFVELAAAEADADPVQASFVRRTLASLGAALKNLVVKDQSPTRSTTVSYRESVLLRLLKKTLDPPGARAVLIGTVLPDRSCYVSTLQTMNFCSRLLSRSSLPGTSLSRKGGDRWRYEKTHRSSPFPSAISSTSGISDNKTPGSGEGVMTQLLESEGRRERADLLKNVLSDPRQRVARLLSDLSPLREQKADVRSPSKRGGNARSLRQSSDKVHSKSQNEASAAFEDGVSSQLPSASLLTKTALTAEFDNENRQSIVASDNESDPSPSGVAFGEKSKSSVVKDFSAFEKSFDNSPNSLTSPDPAESGAKADSEEFLCREDFHEQSGGSTLHPLELLETSQQEDQHFSDTAAVHTFNDTASVAASADSVLLSWAESERPESRRESMGADLLKSSSTSLSHDSVADGIISIGSSIRNAVQLKNTGLRRTDEKENSPCDKVDYPWSVKSVANLQPFRTSMQKCSFVSGQVNLGFMTFRSSIETAIEAMQDNHDQLETALQNCHIHWDTFAKNIASMENDIKSKKELLEESRKDISLLNEKNVLIQRALEEKECVGDLALSNLQSKYKDTLASLSAAQMELTDVGKKCATFSQDIQSAAKQAKTERENAEAAEKRVTMLEEELKSSNAFLRELTKAKRECEVEMKQLYKKMASAEEVSQSACHHVAALQSECNHLRHNLQDRDNRIKNLESDFRECEDSAAAELEQALHERKQVEELVKERDTSVREWEHELKISKQLLNDAKVAVAESESEYHKLERMLNDRNATNSREVERLNAAFRSSSEMFQKERDKFELQDQTLRHQLQAEVRVRQEMEKSLRVMNSERLENDRKMAELQDAFKKMEYKEMIARSDRTLLEDSLRDMEKRQRETKASKGWSSPSSSTREGVNTVVNQNNGNAPTAKDATKSLPSKLSTSKGNCGNSTLTSSIQAGDKSEIGDRETPVALSPANATSVAEERARRKKAEEIAAVIAKRAKSSLEKRNATIAALKTELAKLSEHRDAEVSSLKFDLEHVLQQKDKAEAIAAEIAMRAKARLEAKSPGHHSPQISPRDKHELINGRERIKNAANVKEAEKVWEVVKKQDSVDKVNQQSLIEIREERDVARKSLRKYKLLARRLVGQLQEIDSRLYFTSLVEEEKYSSEFNLNNGNDSNSGNGQ